MTTTIVTYAAARRLTVPPTGSWWVDTQRPDGTLDGVSAAEEAARMIRADSSKTSHGGDK